MKLRNKKTGEIVEAHEIDLIDEHVYLKIFRAGNYDTKQYNSFAELNEEWEDAPEEPKEHWHIGCEGDVFIDNTERNLKSYSSIGNDFETKEEAEKAVEKLKAWKRLKDKGFRFNGWNGTEIGSNISYISELYYEGCADDMDLLFGGEE